MNVTCDNCNKSFKVKNEKRWLDKDIQEVFFKCTHCKTVYRVAITNGSIRKLQNKIEKLKKVVREKVKQGNENNLETLEIIKLTEKLKIEMDKLNGKA